MEKNEFRRKHITFIRDEILRHRTYYPPSKVGNMFDLLQQNSMCKMRLGPVRRTLSALGTQRCTGEEDQSITPS